MYSSNRTLFTFGYSIPDGAEILLNYSDLEDDRFKIAAARLANLTELPVAPDTHVFPFDLPNNDPHFEEVSQFRFDDWDLAAGICNTTEDEIFRVFLINKEDHDFALVYDFGSGVLFTLIANGFGLLGQEGSVYKGEEIYDLLGFNPDPLPLPEKKNTNAIADNPSSVETPYPSKPRIYDFSLITSPGGECRIYSDGDIFETIAKEMRETLGFHVYEKTLYYPHFANNPEMISSITSFNPSEWFPLAANLNRAHYVTSVLFVRKDNPGVAFVGSLLKQSVYAVVTNGYTLLSQGERLGIMAILERSGRFKEGKYIETSYPNSEIPPLEKVEEKPVETPEEKPLEAPIVPPVSEASATVTSSEEIVVDEQADDAFIEKEEATTSLTPLRHVYRTRRYDRCVESLRKKHPELPDKLAKIYQALLTSTDEDLNHYLFLKKSKAFNGLDWCSIAKFKVANSGPFQADRIFYLRGDSFKNALGRGIPSDAIVLLYLSDTSEHDEQGEIARNIEKKMKDEENNVLSDLNIEGTEPTLEKEVYEIAFQRSSSKERPSYSQYGVLSVSQNDVLHKEKAPCAFSGSAGTGKTLMSIDLYRNFRKEYPDYRILYLTYQDALKGQVQRSFAELGVPSECLTYRDIAYQELGNDIPFREQKDFVRWALSKYVMVPGGKANLSKITPDLGEAADIAYVFYRGVIEGSSRNQSRRQADLLSEKDFLLETESEKGFSVEQKKKIYEIASAYRDHVDRHQEITDNIAAEKLMKKPHPLYDVIIVDETQDLTELQVLSICSLLKEGSKQLYLFGDDNQAINPTIFTIEEAAACIKMSLGPGIEVPVQVLRGAYRSSNFLVRYINDINKVKRQAIGAYGFENDADETTLRNDEKGSLPRLIDTPALADALLTSPATFKADTVVIVPNAELNADLQAKYPTLKDDVVTISEAKGREWDNAIVYDFLSSASELWEAMLSEERAGKKSTLHRMLFNRYYVALTRARDRLIIVEDNVTPRIYDALLKTLTPIRKEKEIPQYLTDALKKEDWLAYAYASFNDRDFAGAKRCLNKIPLEEQDEQTKQLSEDIDDYQLFIGAPQGFAKEELSKIGGFIDCFLRHNDIDFLKKLYGYREANSKLRLLSLDENSDLEVLNEATAYLLSQPQNFTPAEQRFYQNRLFGFFDQAIKGSLNKLETILGGHSNATR